MITWVTVWVLTVVSCQGCNGSTFQYQLNYATQETCLRQKKNHSVAVVSRGGFARCDFQQIPVVTK